MRLPTQPDPLATPCHQKCFAQILARHKCTPGACRICRLLQNDADNEESLTNAAEKGFAYCLASLIDAGVAPDVADARGLSPLHHAAGNGRTACVELLLAAGADPNRANHAAGLTPLHGAALGGHVECLRLLLEKGGDPDRCDNHGLTPLTRAAGKCAECVQVLLDFGADPDADFCGWGPLHVATRSGAPKAVVGALLDAGADPNLPRADGITPLADALRRGRRSAVPLLMRAGATVVGTDRLLLLPRGAANADAWAYADAVAAAGGWAAHVQAHRKLWCSYARKCTDGKLVDDVLGLVVDFLAPPGGS